MLAERIQSWTQQWKQQGIEQGIATHARTTLRRQLTRRFGSLPAAIENRINQAQADQLDSWLRSGN
jgi:hypothetical protein